MDLREYFRQRFKETGEEFVVTSEQFGESPFEIYAPELHKRGWSVYPQERTSRRIPARIEGEVIAWSKYQSERPSDELMTKWALHASTHNVAVIMGPSSGNAIAIDVDVTDEWLSVRIENLITRVLGHTDYRRIGNEPKIMLFYRLAETASFNKRTHVLAKNGDPDVASKHMVEILAKAATVTFYGRHHSTGERFKWLEHACQISPMELPVTTEAKIEEFERALDELYKVYKPASKGYSLDASSYPSPNGDLIQVNPSDEEKYPRNAANLVCDKREEWLYALTWETVRANFFSEYPPEIVAELAGMIFAGFRKEAAPDGRWTDGFLSREINSKLRRVIATAMSGGMMPNLYITRNDDGSITQEKPLPPALASAFARMAGTGLEWITAGKAFVPTHSRWKIDPIEPVRQTELVEQRKLLTDRDGLTKTAARIIDKTVGELVRSIINRQHGNLLRVLKAPTGVGKTSRSMRRLIALMIKRPGLLRPGQRIIFNVPKYENAQELLRVAEEVGAEILTHDSEIPRGPADPTRPRVGLWVGKKHTDCPNHDQMDAMEKEDIAPGRVCKAGKLKCKIWEAGQCKYHRQGDIYESAQIVICVVSYLTMHSVPEALSKGAVALIVDEDPVLNIVREWTLKLEDLLSDRSGTTTKKLIERGLDDPEVVKEMRKSAVDVVVAAIKAGKDAAAALLDYTQEFEGRVFDGWEFLACAKAVIEQVRATELKIEPNMSAATIEKILANQGPTWGGITAERHFWRVISDRMEMLKQDRINHSLWKSAVRSAWALVRPTDPEAVRAAAERKARHMEAHPPRASARGATDARLQLRGHVEKDAKGAVTKHVHTCIRISRRIETKFQNIPALLLDASAQMPLVSKVFGRDVQEIQVPAAPHLRVAVCLDEVYSDASLCPNDDDKLEAVAKKEARVRKIRLMIAKACDQYAPARVLLTASQKVLDVLLYAWRVPGNLDWMYYGNLRGLDGAKHHSAIITVGRSQMPPESIDAKAAAISYDDDTPDTPLDRMGTGYTADGQPIKRTSKPRRLQLRNGETIVRYTPEMPSERGRQIERAWRDEELRQAVGRLRPIHRDGSSVPPLWIAIGGSAIAEDFVVDEIFSLDDAIADAGPADARRRAGEIISDQPPLKLAEKRRAKEDEHASLELRIERIRAQHKEMSTLAVRAVADKEELADWRRKEWARLGLSDQIMAMIDAPERLTGLGLDPDDLDNRVYEAWAASNSQEPTDSQGAVAQVQAPAMETPVPEPVAEEPYAYTYEDDDLDSLWTG